MQISSDEPAYRNWPHPWFGFFRLKDKTNCYVMQVKGLPQVTDFIDHAWNYPQKNKLVNYLERGCEIAQPADPGEFKCLLCNELVTARLFQWDGAWLWPSSLAHYVDKHDIRLPDSMLRHIEEHNFTISMQEAIESRDRMVWPPQCSSESWWKSFLHTF